MYQKPSAHRIDSATGEMSGATGRYEKRLGDLVGLYGDDTAYKHTILNEPDRVVYYVQDVRPQQDHSDLIFGTTWMEPGRIGNEFYMTRGHIHARANRPETYYGESGEGVMLLENPEGETKILEISKRVLVYVPPMWIHRSVNTGSQRERLEGDRQRSLSAAQPRRCGACPNDIRPVSTDQSKRLIMGNSSCEFVIHSPNVVWFQLSRIIANLSGARNDQLYSSNKANLLLYRSVDGEKLHHEGFSRLGPALGTW